MAWVVAGIIFGVAVGAFVTFAVVIHNISSGVGAAFGWPTPRPWWKFWK